LKKKTRYYIAIRIPSKTSKAVLEAMQALHDGFSEHFADIFKTITADNDGEFADFAQVEQWAPKCFLLTCIPLESGAE
jgi:IS30 family transposase